MAVSTMVTGSMIYDAEVCPHRVAMDLRGDAADRDQVSPFVAMLWRCGVAHEDRVVAGLGARALDLRGVPGPLRREATTRAMGEGAPLIVGGEIAWDDLLGRPDLLRLEADGYVAGDVKSGAAEEERGGSARLKPGYGVQVAHYAMILGELGAGPSDRGFIVDGKGLETAYPLDAPVGSRTIAELHAELLRHVRAVRDGGPSLGALSATCKLCHWRTACGRALREADDLTLVPQLGRALRDAMAPHVPTLAALAALDPATLATKGGRTVVPRLGLERLERFRDRARLVSDPEARPYARAPVPLERAGRELMFDIEADPGRDIVYLHGIVERIRSTEDDRETFVTFFAEEETAEAEREAFAGAFSYLTADQDARIYYWSKYERTAYRRLQARYPDVCTVDDVEALFDPARAVDLLYDVVMPHTEWPTSDHSIKSIAKWCGFRWRDVDPSGAASIEWFDRWVATRDPALRQRILDYNEDDCIATRVVLDAILGLPLRTVT